VIMVATIGNFDATFAIGGAMITNACASIYPPVNVNEMRKRKVHSGMTQVSC